MEIDKDSTIKGNKTHEIINCNEIYIKTEFGLEENSDNNDYNNCQIKKETTEHIEPNTPHNNPQFIDCNLLNVKSEVDDNNEDPFEKCIKSENQCKATCDTDNAGEDDQGNCTDPKKRRENITLRNLPKKKQRGDEKGFIIKENNDNKVIVTSANDTEKQRLNLPGIKQKINKKCSIKSKIHSCKICTYKTTTVTSLNKHCNNNHNGRKTKTECQFCEKSFKSKQSLDYHLLKQHRQEMNSNVNEFVSSKIHICNICSYETTKRNKLNAHVNLIHNDVKTKINCQFCDKTFTRKYGLDDHLLKQHKHEIQHDIKNYITSKIHTCDICFYYETVSTVHLHTHVSSVHNNSNDAKINCRFCDKSFTKKYTLDGHLLKQHPEEIKNSAEDLITSEIYKCTICNYQSTKKDHVNMHMNAVHNEDRAKLICQFCDKVFKIKQSLEDHLLKHHKREIESNTDDFITSKVHLCETCAYQTTRVSHLNAHINSMHKH